MHSHSGLSLVHSPGRRLTVVADTLLSGVRLLDETVALTRPTAPDTVYPIDAGPSNRWVLERTTRHGKRILREG
jgi:hypothetical protein